MGNPTVTAGQGIFSYGIDPTARVLVDSTKGADTSAEIVAGFPLALVASTGLLDSTAAATGDIFYGAANSNINTLLGRISTDQSPAQANAELIGRYSIRNSVFLDTNGDSLTASVFATFAGAEYTPLRSDIGKKIHAMKVTVTTTNTDDAFEGDVQLRWVVSTGSGTGSGFASVGYIVDVSDDGSETQINLTGGRVAFATGLSSL